MGCKSSKTTAFDILGEKFIDCATMTECSGKFLNNTQLLGLYFGSDWAEPSRGFTPLLGDHYKVLKAKKCMFSVVYISMDADSDAFSVATRTMPWHSLPYDEEISLEMKKKYNVEGLPCVVLVSRRGVVYDNAREIFASTPTSQAVQLFKKYRKIIFGNMLDLYTHVCVCVCVYSTQYTYTLHMRIHMRVHMRVHIHTVQYTLHMRIHSTLTVHSAQYAYT
eukprot:GHVR01190494.1.p1 GENE.GHVR01190494.1~~GHVR01190494.1.p1  ORF type:complete len:221 (+),score=38.28 GHVR01190494.1:51-713(+)